MNSESKIIPAILVKNIDEFKEKMKFLEGHFDLAQLDVMDGVFVDNATFFDLNQIKEVKTSLKYELHLMVKDWLGVATEWLKFNQLIRVIIHLETIDNQADFIDFVQTANKKNIQVGLALNPPTPIEKIKDYCGLIDLVLLMGVYPGFSGQNFIQATLKKIKAAKKICPKVKVAVDGGVNLKNAKSILKAGADYLNSASMVFSGDLNQLKQFN